MFSVKPWPGSRRGRSGRSTAPCCPLGIPTALSPQGSFPAFSQGMQRFGRAAAGDGLTGARAELDAPHVFHGRFANVPEQGEVPKQITTQDTAHPSPPSCPRLVLGHLPCLGGREGGRAWPPAEAVPLHHRLGMRVGEGKGVCVCVCVGCQLSALP